MCDETVWCEVRLDEVAEVIGGYELSENDACYHEADWGVARATSDQLLQRTARNGFVVDLTAKLEPVEQNLSNLHNWGLASLIL